MWGGAFPELREPDGGWPRLQPLTQILFPLSILPDTDKATIYVKIYKHTHTPIPRDTFKRKYLNSLLWSTSSSAWLPSPYHGHRSLFHSAMFVPSGICVNTILPQDLGTGCSLCLESSFLRFVHVLLPNIIQVFAQMLPNRGLPRPSYPHLTPDSPLPFIPFLHPALFHFKAHYILIYVTCLFSALSH